MKIKTVALCNELSKKILTEKYMAPGETDPEDIFYRVSQVGAIPDVIDRLVEDSYLFHKDMRDCFKPYEDLYDRVVKRRGIKVSPSDSIKVTTADEIEQIWKEETQKYHRSMCELDWMPGSPILMNCGNFGMLSSCFFIRVEDSMDGIFKAVKDVGLISKAGGGVGLDFSLLRFEGAPIKGTGGTSSGPISFMEVFNATGETVKQGGRRKGALLASLRIDHPDSVKFIKCKNEEGKLNNFNISVLVTDEFMKKLEHTEERNKAFIAKFKGEEYVISTKDDQAILFDDDHEKDWFKTSIYSNQQVWDLLCKQAHINGEPGIIYTDIVNADDPLEGKYGPLGQNACSELHLVNYDSCNLASINLANCVNEYKNDVDYSKLERLVRLGVRFLDNVIDLNNYPLPETEEISLKLRRLGLGIFGFHDFLLKVGARYGSQACESYISRIWSKINGWAVDESQKLGEIRGVFPAFEEIKDSYNKKPWYNRRNIGLLTCMPTGTVSFIANQTSSGIEPNFQWSYVRKDSYGDHIIKHWILDEYEELPKWAQTALEIPPEEHVKVQAAIQKYVDSGISKTANMPSNATIEDVNKIFRLAYDLKCKSITVYRTQSRKKEVLNIKKSEERDSNKQELNQNTQLEPSVKSSNLVKSEEWNGNDRRKENIRERPQVLFGATIKLNTPDGPAYISVNEDDEGIREVLVAAAACGTSVNVHAGVEGRLISNSLQHRVPVDSVLKHLKDQKSNPVWEKGGAILSLPHAIYKAILIYKNLYEGFSEYLPENITDSTGKEEIEEHLSGDLCPECGENLYMEGGCNVCKSCGYSRCN